MSKQLVIAGISTEVGKTVISAIFTEALKADYWKPIQSGSAEDSDKEMVKSLVSNSKSIFHPEAYCLQAPLSPHAAAHLEGISIDMENIQMPDTSSNLVIEMAGGLMVPLNDTHLSFDLLKSWRLPVVLVANYYLGSINHTLLSIEILKSNNIPIHSIVFNGEVVPESRDAILRYSQVSKYFEIPQISNLEKSSIEKYARQIAARV